MTACPSPFRAPSAPCLLERAEDALAHNDPRGAAALFRQACAWDPAQAGALYLMGQALRDLGRSDEGGAWRRRAFLADSAALPTANHRLGMAFARAGQVGRAVAGQLQALDQNPGHGPAAAALERLAADALAAGEEEGGLDAGLWTRTGHAAFRLCAFPLAQAAFRRAAAARPDDPALCRYLGDTHAALADHGGAETVFQRGVVLDPGDAGLWAGLAHARFHQEDRGGALPAFAHAAGLIPENEEYRRCLADALFLLRRTEEAAHHLARALALAPDAGGLWTNLGHTRFRQRDYAGAVAAFTRALTLSPDAPELERFRDIAAYRHLNARVMAGEGTGDIPARLVLDRWP